MLYYYITILVQVWSFMLRIFILLFVLLAPPAKASDLAQPIVVTSIRPLHKITNEILGNAGQAKLLIENSQNPHHFQLKPSQLKLLAKTDLLIWVSNDFETGLAKLNNIIKPASQRLELLAQLPEQQRIGHDHDVDGHIWLSPENLISISEMITQHLSRLMPTQTPSLEANRDQLNQRIRQWQSHTIESFKGMEIRYILDHPFLNYFERSFGLSHSGSLRQLHDHSSSIKQLSWLHRLLDNEPTRCLLVSSLPISKQAKQIQQQYELEVHLIDILDYHNQYRSIVDMLEDISVKLQSCEIDKNKQ